MYLKRIDLTNFKCFSEQELKLSKITLLLGANSTGKSSLIYSLLAALQSDQFPMSLSANGPFATLGDFRAISHLHRSDQNIGIALTFGLNDSDSLIFKGVFSESPKTGMPQMIAAEFDEAAFSLKITKGEKYKAEWTYNIDKDPSRKLNELAAYRNLLQSASEIIKKMEPKKEKGIKKSSRSDEDFLASPPKVGSFSFNSPADFLKNLSSPLRLSLGMRLTPLVSNLSGFERSFNYLGSFRLEPQRTYYQVSRANLKVKRDGSNHIEQINEWEEKKASELTLLKKSLRKLSLLSNLRTSRLRSGIFEVKVRTSTKGVPVSIADVGFGIGQLLPILVADLQLPKGSTLAISQPEIHLHPSVQADLAEYFVDRSHSKGNRYIIETHSEYFINRLRLLITKGKLNPDDISVLYLSQGKSGLTSHPITFAASGQIVGAPKDFFQTYMMDVMNIAMEVTK